MAKIAAAVQITNITEQLMVNAYDIGAECQQKCSVSGNRTRITWVKTRYANRYTKTDLYAFLACGRADSAPASSHHSMLGLGTWKADNTTDVVYAAIKAGFRRIDCAFEYENERQVGEGIRRAISDGIVAREDLTVTTKLWCTFHKPEYVAKQCRQSLKNLQLDYLDAFLIHWPIAFEQYERESMKRVENIAEDSQVNAVDLYPRINGHIQLDEKTTLQDTWRAMEQLVD